MLKQWDLHISREAAFKSEMGSEAASGGSGKNGGFEESPESQGGNNGEISVHQLYQDSRRDHVDLTKRNYLI